MKLFADMTPIQKLDYIDKCMTNALPEVKDVTCLADILDVWDYWVPYLLNRCRKLELVAYAARMSLHTMTEIEQDDSYCDLDLDKQIDLLNKTLGDLDEA